MRDGVVSAAFGAQAREFVRWFAREVKESGRVAAMEDECERYEFGEFVPEFVGEQVTASEFDRRPGRYVSAVVRASRLDAPVLFAQAQAGFVRVMAGSVRPVGADLEGFVLG